VLDQSTTGFDPQQTLAGLFCCAAQTQFFPC
jgi:hypothetical protein